MIHEVLLVEPWGVGGTANYVNYLAAALARTSPDGGRIALLVAGDFPYQPEGCEVRRLLPTARRRSARPMVNGLRLAQRAVAAQQVIIRELKQRRPTTLQFSGSTMVTGRVLATARRLGIPVVTAMHDIPPPGLSAANLLWLQWRPHFVRSDAILVHGPWAANELRARYPECPPPVVIRYGPFWFGVPKGGAAGARAANGLSRDQTVVLFFGSLRRDKGLSLLLQALHLDTERRFHLHVVGNRPAVTEPPAEQYMREADELGIASSVTWRIGYVLDDDVPDVFVAADIVVLPYGPSYTAYSAVLAMAVAYERPVAASAVGDTGQAITDFDLGVTTTDHSAQGLLDALCQVADAPERFGPNLRTYGSEFSWDAMAASTWRLYEERQPT